MNSLVVKYHIEGAENRILEKRLTPHSEEDVGLAMNFLAKTYEVGDIIVLHDAHNFDRESRLIGTKKCQWCGCVRDVVERVVIPEWPREKWLKFKVGCLPGLGRYAIKMDSDA